MKLSIEEKIQAGFAVGLSLLVLIGVAAVWSSTIVIVAFAILLATAMTGIARVLIRRDLRKRQQAEAERDRFFTLSLDLLCIARTDGYFKRLNPAFTQTLGWGTEELLARSFLEFVHPDDRASTLREIEKLAAGQQVIHFENRYECKDGSWRILSWKSSPQPDGLIYATARDVTELKHTQDALRRSEESLAVTLQSIGDAVLATDTEGRVTRMNHVAEMMTGWKQMEAVGQFIGDVFRIINEETRQPAVIPVDRVLATGVIQGLANHTLLLSRDGREWPIADSASPIRDQDGPILGVVLVFRDVTDERKAEQAVRESERRLRILNEELERRVHERTVEVREALATLDATVEAAFIFYPDELGHTYVNDGATLQVGYSREELLAMTPVDLQPEFNETSFREMLEPMLQGQKRAHLFTTLHRHNELYECQWREILRFPARYFREKTSRADADYVEGQFFDNLQQYQYCHLHSRAAWRHLGGQ